MVEGCIPQGRHSKQFQAAGNDAVSERQHSRAAAGARNITECSEQRQRNAGGEGEVELGNQIPEAEIGALAAPCNNTGRDRGIALLIDDIGEY